jgi:hypothetical protein
MLPDFERADRIDEFWGNPKTRTFAELLIDCDEDRTLERCSSGCCERPIASRGTRVASGEDRTLERFSSSRNDLPVFVIPE